MKMRTAKNSIRCLYNEYHDDRIEGVDRIEAYVVQVYKRPAKRDQSRDIAKGWLQVFTMDDTSHRSQASF